MGKLAEQIKEARQKAKVRPLRVDTVLAELSPEDRKDLLAALDDAKIPARTIENVLRARGVSLSQNAVRNYRITRNVAK
jgi:hypothetical protein